MPRSVVYVVSAGWRVKIGTTTDLGRRLREIQSCCPLEVRLEGTAPGGRGLEQELHRRFAKDRVHGEWFELVKADRERLLAQVEAHPNVTFIPRARRRQHQSRRH